MDDVSCVIYVTHIIHYFIFSFSIHVIHARFKMSIRSQSNKFNKKKTEGKDNTELFRKNVGLIVMEKLTFQISVLCVFCLEHHTVYCNIKCSRAMENCCGWNYNVTELSICLLMLCVQASNKF